MFVHTPRQVTPTREHLGSFAACFGVHLLIITLNSNFNSPLILNNFQFSSNSSIPLPLLLLYAYFKNREKILSDLWELAL